MGWLSLAIWILLMRGLTLPFGFCLWWGYPCHLGRAYGGSDLATKVLPKGGRIWLLGFAYGVVKPCYLGFGYGELTPPFRLTLPTLLHHWTSVSLPDPAPKPSGSESPATEGGLLGGGQAGNVSGGDSDDAQCKRSKRTQEAFSMCE